MADTIALVLSNPTVRQKAIDLIGSVPDRTRVVFNGPKRTLPQNARIWSGMRDLSRQVVYHGQRLPVGDWATLFMDAVRRENKMQPALYDDGWVPMRRGTSDLSVKEAELFISLMYKWGYEHGVVFSVDEQDGIDHER